MEKIKEVIVDVLYEMAKEDCYGKPHIADGVTYRWSHWSSEDGELDYMFAKLDTDNQEFVLDNGYPWGKPIENNDLDTFILRLLCVCRHYRKLNPTSLAILRNSVAPKNRTWEIEYGRRWPYKTKQVVAVTMEDAIKRARVKTMREIDIKGEED